VAAVVAAAGAVLAPEEEEAHGPAAALARAAVAEARRVPVAALIAAAAAHRDRRWAVLHPCRDRPSRSIVPTMAAIGWPTADAIALRWETFPARAPVEIDLAAATSLGIVPAVATSPAIGRAMET
jgi:hypothetical protein